MAEQNEPLAPSERTKLVTAFAKNEVLPTDKRPEAMLPLIGWYFPYYVKDADLFLGHAGEVFDKFADRFINEQGREPVFLDLGSGDGMLVAVAASTGKYKQSVGVEYNSALNDKAREYMTDLGTQGALETDKTKLVTGSYYTKEYWGSLRDKFVEENKESINSSDPTERISAGFAVGLRATVETAPSPQQILDALNKMGDQTGTMQDAEIIGSDGKLEADVVFAYPSDAFFKDSADQWVDIMRTGTFFVLASNRQTAELEQDSKFKESFEFVEKMERKGVERFPGQADASICLVYRRK